MTTIKFVSILLFFTLLIKAQQSDYKIERLPLGNGISHNMIYSIMQDSDGFIWFGTMYGLVRYDGLEFKKYRTDPYNSNSLSDDDIVNLIESSDSSLIIGTFGGGLNIFDKYRNEYKHFTPSSLRLNKWDGIVWKIIEDSKGNIWFASDNSGVMRLRKNGNLKVYQNNKDDSTSTLSLNYIRSFYNDNNGNLWLGGYEGILKYDHSSDSFKTFSHKNLQNKLVHAFASLNKNELLCGTNNGIYLFSFVNHSFTKLKINNKSFNEIVNTIVISDSNELWIGTENGLYHCNAAFELLNHFTSGSKSIYGNSVITLIEDKSGIIWVGSYSGGVSKIIKKPKLFDKIVQKDNQYNGLPNGRVTDLAEDSKGNIWVTTTDGISKLNKKLKLVASYFESDSKIQLTRDNSFNTIEIGSNDELLLGTNYGLYILDESIQILETITKDSHGIVSNRITKLFSDSNNDLWIGTTNGLSRLNVSNYEVFNYSHYEELKGLYITTIFEDKYGDIWAGTFAGLNKINPEENNIFHISPGFKDSTKISNKYVFDIIPFNDNSLWIGTGNGINVYNFNKNSFSYITELNGLSNEVIAGIIDDNMGSIFLGTKKGISKYDRSNNTFYNYNIDDGLSDNIFTSGASLLTRSKKIIFGGLNGISIIDPSNFSLNKNIPNTKVNEIKIFDSVLTSIPKSNVVKLSYDENFITIKYSSLEFTNPTRNRFAYFLEGGDKNWKRTSSNQVSYSSLQPGEYKFKVMSSNNDGVWNKEYAEINILITPPFWKTVWFYLFVFGFISALGYYWHSQNTIRKIDIYLKIENAKKVENERLRKRTAEDFHDELGHRLTRISLFIELLKKQFSHQNITETKYLARMTTLTKELSNSIRDFIWTLDPSNDTLYDTLIRLKDFADDLFYQTNIVFTFEGINPELKTLNLSVDWRRHLTLIFKEAMNNIIKYANCKTVTMNVEKNLNEITISLIDDGKGFEITKANNGNGLNNMKSRAEYLQSKLLIISKCGEGTQIIFKGILT